MEAVDRPNHCLLLNVGVVAKKAAYLTVIRDLQAIWHSHLRFKLVAMATVSNSTVSSSTVCDRYAGETEIRHFTDPMALLEVEYLDLILELTGDTNILAALMANKPQTMGVLDRTTAMLFFDIAALSNQMAEQQQEITLATSFASALLEASPDGVLVINRDNRIVNCNDSPLIGGGVGREAVIGRFCHEVMRFKQKPCESPDRTCPSLETLKTGRPARTVEEISIPDGTTHVCQITTYPIVNNLGRISQIVITVRDMTKDLNERIEARAQSIKENLSRFVQDDRLSSLGRLVASVCHEINNPLTSIVTFNKLILTYAKEKDLGPHRLREIERYLGLSVHEALRCGEIVKNLLTFARQKDVEAKRIDLVEMVNTILLLVNHQLEHGNIEVQVDIPKSGFHIKGDSAQIQQCLMNLVFNAMDTMPRGGRMTVSGGFDDPNQMVWLSITDSGAGIDPDDLPRIFEPFYSTKTEGKGVGLGLSMVYGIIRAHSGTIEVDSEMGQGSTFRIRLPQFSKPSQHTEHGQQGLGNGI